MKRTSKTRSASRGTPNLYPKLMSWMTSCSASVGSPRCPKIVSRSSRSDRSDVSRTTSASSRTGSSSRRSSAIELAVPRWSAKGCRWRVSENRRMRTSSRASRKKTWGRMPRPSSAPRIAANARGASPDRTSRTIATRENRSRSLDTSSARPGRSSLGRLSTTAYPRSSKSFAAAVLPPPERPLTTTTCWPVPGARADSGPWPASTARPASSPRPTSSAGRASSGCREVAIAASLPRASGRSDRGGFEAEEEPERERQHDPRDTNPDDEEQQGDRDPGTDDPPLLGRQAGSHERPDLVEDHGHREDDPDDEGDLQVEEERAPGAQRDELPVADRCAQQVDDRPGPPV